jgi:hypothetical protein
MVVWKRQTPASTHRLVMFGSLDDTTIEPIASS